jgi:hypothetical protein
MFWWIARFTIEAMVDYQEEGGENGYACTNALAPVYERNI